MKVRVNYITTDPYECSGATIIRGDYKLEVSLNLTELCNVPKEILINGVSADEQALFRKLETGPLFPYERI